MIQNTLDYLYGLKAFGSKLGLERVSQLMGILGHPYQNFKSVHVAGTNGKGSTCSFLASILQESGYKVGLYTSPHLVRFNERIQINRKEISDEELAELTEEIREKLEKNNLETTFFEFTTALAFLYFGREKVDLAIIEVGLGGRLDATNVITPLVSVITNIGLEHTKILGESKEKIAVEKGGIIKKDVPVVTTEKDLKVREIFSQICQERETELIVAKEENFAHQLGLLGEHQVDNALAAQEVVKILRKKDFVVSEENLRTGLEQTVWPGRLEKIYNQPLIIVDGAHNVEGLEKLKDFILQNYNDKRKVLIFGTSKDKTDPQIKGMVSLIEPWFDQVILTKGSFKPMDLDYLKDFFLPETVQQEKTEDALKEAASLAEKEDLIVVAGSIYLVGDVLAQRSLFSKLFK